MTLNLIFRKNHFPVLVGFGTGEGVRRLPFGNRLSTEAVGSGRLEARMDHRGEAQVRNLNKST